MFAGVRYCIDHCLEHALAVSLRRLLDRPLHAGTPHRVPLGLLLLSRQQITADQLQLALETQREHAHGRIGDWLQTMGFVSEPQVTAAVAHQWSCAVLRPGFVPSPHGPRLPGALLDRFLMLPVDYVEPISTLHLAFAERIDYSVMYAIEQMTGCHTEPCMALPSFIRQNLQAMASQRSDSELVFERVLDVGEASRIIRSYCARVSASEIRLAACAPYLWIRFLCRSREPVDLLLRSPEPAPIQYV